MTRRWTVVLPDPDPPAMPMTTAMRKWEVGRGKYEGQRQAVAFSLRPSRFDPLASVFVLVVRAAGSALGLGLGAGALAGLAARLPAGRRDHHDGAAFRVQFRGVGIHFEALGSVPVVERLDVVGQLGDDVV